MASCNEAPDPFAPIAPPPNGANRITWRLGHEITAEQGGLLRLGSEPTRELLNEMMCLSARISTILSIELLVQPLVSPTDKNGITAAPPTAKFTQLRVQCPPEDAHGSRSLRSLQSWLKVGTRRWEALTSVTAGRDGAGPSGLCVEYLFWRRCGGGPDGADPVFCFRLTPLVIEPRAAGPLGSRGARDCPGIADDGHITATHPFGDQKDHVDGRGYCVVFNYLESGATSAAAP